MCGSAAATIRHMTVCSSASDPTSPNDEASWIEQHGNHCKIRVYCSLCRRIESAVFVDDESFDAELSFVGDGNAHVIEMPLPFGGVAWIPVQGWSSRFLRLCTQQAGAQLVV